VTPRGRGIALAALPATLAAAVAGVAGCADEGAAPGAGGSGGDEPDATPWVWDLPAGFPVPIVPEDDPMTEAKVELGRHLFFDPRLSLGQTQSCASCHQPALAFTDGRARALLASGDEHPRSAPSLANVAWASSLGWANPVLTRLEAHVVVPLFGTDPEELGWSGLEDQLEARLAAIPAYQDLFSAAYPESDQPVDVHHVVQALATFQRTIVSGDAPWDRFRAGDEAALGASERRGLDLFASERLSCSQCHAGWATTDAVIDAEGGGGPTPFHNTGLYDVGGTGAYPEPSPGLVASTGEVEDSGKFRTPSLRNVAVTAPYMHDGSLGTLDEVIDHYARGGRLIEAGPDAGDGRDNPYKDARIRGFTLSPDERADLLAFLHALTDPGFLSDPHRTDPWSTTP
jgi:cytochrome c peroxidase